jgi:hypothetical protein
MPAVWAIAPVQWLGDRAGSVAWETVAVAKRAN